MYNGKKILAIIPARSGSKGLMDKNIKLLGGKPLIAHTIEHAQEANIFDDIVFTSDSEEYIKIAKEFGDILEMLRVKELAADTAGIGDTIIDVLKRLEKMNKTYNYLVLLQPTSPLRNASDILNSMKLIFESNGSSVVSMCKCEKNPLWSCQLDKDGNLDSKKFNIVKNIPRQSLNEYYELNGAIYISEISEYIKNISFYEGICKAYIMSKENSIDIDDIYDFRMAEIILEEKINRKNNHK